MVGNAIVLKRPGCPDGDVKPTQTPPICGHVIQSCDARQDGGQAIRWAGLTSGRVDTWREQRPVDWLQWLKTRGLRHMAGRTVLTAEGIRGDVRE